MLNFYNADSNCKYVYVCKYIYVSKYMYVCIYMGFPGCASGKEPACQCI